MFRRGTAEEILAALSPLIDLPRSEQASRPALETLLKLVVEALVFLREEKRKTMKLESVCDATSFEGVVGLAYNESLPPDMRTAIADYLYELPGFVLEAVNAEGGKSDDPIYANLDIDVPRKQHDHYRSFLLKSLATEAAA
ncbi:MAG: hypothetical protein GC185_05980 [Alphaproteobacteria bacterium]|nr:hypothetical protein [Alphaproteobacteria bacterium]